MFYIPFYYKKTKKSSFLTKKDAREKKQAFCGGGYFERRGVALNACFFFTGLEVIAI